MKEYMVKYYLSEQNWAILVGIIGIVLLIMGITLWRTSETNSLNRGIGYALLAGGIIFAAAGTGVAIYNRTKAVEIEKIVHIDDTEAKASETVRMENVMSSSYKGAIIMFTSCIILGLIAILLLGHNPLIRGIGLGLLLFGTIGHFMESNSMKRNNAYLNEVKEYIIQSEIN
ncbi:hypothetical protein D0T84_17105 [Dysgonomonas sp. 521]|uniref:hypothetical protein n=1 Tax=Dysgonomonas sp. 521 TaxID=2302932 RepID=UPI0013CFFC1F|nr:hypothetical protein [Dysgonomonas sp. 521]NDV96617.1 hypothetical protein [Dysgonomonas sp. 521]